MDRCDLSLLIYTVLMAVATVLLIATGGSEPDAYLSIAILVYFIYTAVDPSIRGRADMRVLDAALITVFIAVVAVRVLRILGIL